MVHTLKIDRDLRSLLPPLDKEQRASLKKQIEEEGCHDAIKVWKGESIIVDGHHRYEICNELGREFDVVELDFADKAEAAEWMVVFQGGRRNMTPAALAAARGLAYNIRKKSRGGDRKSDSEKSKGQTGLSGDTAEKIAAETGVSPKTVKRDGKFQEALFKLATKAREAIIAGEIRKPTQKAIERLAEYDAPSQYSFVSSVKDGSYATIGAALDSVEKPRKPAKPPKGKPKESAAQFCDQITKKYIGPLTRELLKLAKMTGGQDADFQEAKKHLDGVLQYVKAKRK